MFISISEGVYFKYKLNNKYGEFFFFQAVNICFLTGEKKHPVIALFNQTDHFIHHFGTILYSFTKPIICLKYKSMYTLPTGKTICQSL